MTMTLRLAFETFEIETAYPFGIARGTHQKYGRVWVRLTDGDGVEGWGEADPNFYYGENADTVVAALKAYEKALPADPFDLEAAEAKLAATLKYNPSARAALSAALHDLVGKKLGVPLWKLWGLDPAASPVSSFTIGLDTIEVIRKKVREAAPYPILKVKVGTPDDRAVLQAVREETDKRLRVDANAGWTLKEALQRLPLLEEMGVELIEQPLAPEDLDGLRVLRAASRLPIIADESCKTAADVARLAGVVDGVNIKLSKCGSLREAIRIVHVARAHHMSVMVGCMMESSLGITAAAHFAPLLDYVDLDGAALLKHDPFRGASIEGGRVTLPTLPGLGVTRR